MSEIKKTPPADTNEIASVKRDPFLPLFSGLLQQNDDTLATRGQGKGIKLYEEIERDAHAFACLHKRKMAVISRPWEVTPASKSALDQRAAEVVRTQLGNIGFDHLCLNLLDAINKGFSVGEILWATTGSEIAVSEVRARDQRRFWFGEDYELRLKTLANMLTGEALPERKFIVHSLGAKDGSPYGLGLGSKLFWLVWFKRQGITFWLTFLDKFGSPTAIGTYPQGTQPPDQQKLLDALSAISQDAGVTVPEGMEIKLLEASRGGNAGYEQMCRYMDEQISYCVLGESAGAKNSGGAMASAAITRNEVRLELVQFDADMLSATLNNTLVKWITEYNVPGAKPPTVWRKIVEAEDIKLRAERDQILFNMGMRPDDVYQAENYPGWKFQAQPKNKIQGDGAPAAFAEGEIFPDQTALDSGIEGINPDKLTAQAQAALKPVLDLIAASADYAEVFDRLAETFPAMNTRQLEQTLARAMFVADVWGKLSAQNEQD
jgi:phage gp29-like protein